MQETLSPLATLARVSGVALIADDHEATRVKLRNALRRLCPRLSVVSEAATGTDAWDAYLEHEPALAFLDVRMPGLTGLDVARRIARGAHVVMLVEPDDPVRPALADAGLATLLKPWDETGLATSLAEATRALVDGDAPVDLRQALSPLARQERRAGPDLRVLHGSVGLESVAIPVENVVYLRSEGPRTRVVHTEGDALIRAPLKDLVAMLDGARFWQIDRTIIVNRDRIEASRGCGDERVTLQVRGSVEPLPVGRAFQWLFCGPRAAVAS